jgi:hypothetical protein
MRFKEHCFLRSPEWQTLLLQSPVWPFQTLQTRSLSLRSRLCGTLVDLPSLIIHCSTIDENQTYQTGWEERSDLLMHKVSMMLEDVKKWLTVEAEPLFLSYASSQQVIKEHINYPDIISGILDCVANTALLTMDRYCAFCATQGYDRAAWRDKSGNNSWKPATFSIIRRTSNDGVSVR